MEIHKAKRKFLEYIEIERGRSLKTIENYNRYLDRFFEFSKIKKTEDITINLVREFRLYLNRQRGANVKGQEIGTMKKNTQNYHLIALRAFLKFLAKNEIPSLSPEQIELAKTEARSVDVISVEELRRLLDAIDNEENPETKYRDKAIIELLYSTGLRVSELCSLTRDIDLRRDEFSIRGKGGKVRIVFLSDTAKDSLKKYLGTRRDMSEALFVSVSKNRDKVDDNRGLDRRSVERIVKKYATLAGITKRVTPHVIRHVFATDLLQNGADLRAVQQLLGHSSITTTQVYTHITDKHLREVHKKFHGKGK